MLVAICLFASLILLYFNPLLTAHLVFSERDLLPFFIPPKVLWVSLIRSGEMPFWNPYNYSGIPLLATLQPGIFYPPHLLYLFLPFNIVWNWLIILHFVFAGTNIYLLLRHLKASTAGCIVGGTVFMLSGYLLSVHNLLPHLFAVAWFPLAVLYFIKSLESGRTTYAIWTAIILSMEFLSGAPEIILLTILVLAVIAFIPGAFIDEDVSYYARAKTIFQSLILFSLLISIQFVPFYELKQQSIRTAGLQYLETTTWSLAWRDFIQFFLPDAFGYYQSLVKYWSNQSWLKTIYLGIGPFILSLFYFLEKNRKRWFFLGLILLSLLFALGGNTPLYKLIYHVPPFNSIRYPVKFLFLFFFVIALTSGLGLDQLREGIENNDSKTSKLIQVCFYIGFVFILVWGCLNIFDADVRRYLDRFGFKPPSYNDIWFNLHNLKRFLLFSFMLCMAFLLLLRMKQKRIMIACVIVLLTADLFLANYGFYGAISWKRFIANEGFMQNLSPKQETERYFVTSKTEKDFEGGLNGKEIMISAYASIFGLYSTGGSEVMRVRNHENFVVIIYCGRTIHDSGRFFDISGVRYVTTSYEVDDKNFSYVRSEKIGEQKAYLYEYKNYPGRFFVYGRATFVGDDKTAISKLTDDKIDLRKELIIVDNSKRGRSVDTNAKGTVTLVSYKPNKVVLESNADNNAFLYISDTYYPGWRAHVDGKETKIYRADLAFRAVEVPKGKHTVVFTYVPMSFYIGLCLTIIGILLCIWLWRRDRNTANSKS